MVDAVEPGTLRGLRDRALILLGFAGALRRSELVALDTGHLTARKEGLRFEPTGLRISTSNSEDLTFSDRPSEKPNCTMSMQDLVAPIMI